MTGTNGNRAEATARIQAALPSLSDEQLLLLAMMAVQMHKLSEYQSLVARMAEVKA